ncbi:MAG: multidrug efflux MFS transporter [Streptococcaceae bacterium]|nr:multidrug efflux MFS transporter [Streptococcaceae bacterium]
MAKKEKTQKDKLPREVLITAWVLAFGAIPGMLDSTMVNIAINKLMLDLHTTLDTIQWAITGYVLALAVAVPISNYLMNHFNGKKLYALFLALFGVGSFLSGIAWNVESFIAFRLIQGFAAGVITLLLTSLLMASTPRDKIGQVMAVVGTPMILGPILGPVIGGAIVQYGNWHWIFYINIPIVAIALVLIWKLMPDFKPFNPDSKLDWIGTVLLAGFSAGLMYGITKGSSAKHFFESQEMWVFCSLGLACLVAYIIYDFVKKHDTVLPLKFFAKRNFSAANIAIFLNGIAVNGVMLLLPLYFQNTRGFSTIEAALWLVPQGVGMLIARPLIGNLIDRLGAKPVVLVSIVISFLGSFPLAFVGANSNMIWISVILFIRGIGVGGLTMPLMTDIYMGIDNKDVPAASTGNRIVQNVGSSFGSAVISSIVVAVVTNYMTDHTASLKAQATQKVAEVIAKAKTSGVVPTKEQLTAAAQSVATAAKNTATLHGYQTGFLIASLVLVAIAIPALFLTSKGKKKEEKVA